MQTFWTTSLLAILAFAGTLRADSITLAGGITQSTQDSGTPAVANLSLNNIADTDLFAVEMDFNGTISSPGIYSLASILFVDAIAGASESAFISGSMTITQVGAADQFSVFGCLIDAIACTQGNELDLNFQIPAVQLNQSLATASAIPALLPFDLLEDGGNTDIQGVLINYSYTGASQTPEPSTFALIGASMAGFMVRRWKQTSGGK